MYKNRRHVLESQIIQLMEAINQGELNMAKPILSANFEITTTHGEEQKMEEFLSELSKSRDRIMKRRILPTFDSIFISEEYRTYSSLA